MYEFVFYILEGKLSKVANYVNVKAENIGEAYEKAEATPPPWNTAITKCTAKWG